MNTLSTNMEVIDVVFRYGELTDPHDPFSELVGPLPGIQTELSTAFPQSPASLSSLLGHANSEIRQSFDAFQVRIQSRKGLVNAPVIVFLPGGGFMNGTAHSRWFTAPEFVTDNNVVLVTVNYRLGALGHLGHTGDIRESHRGMRDIMRALQWVASHIADFGGDPNNVTLAGDSAGAWYAYALATLQETRGLFCRLLLVSLPSDPPMTTTLYADRREVFLTGLTNRELPTDRTSLLEAQARFTQQIVGGGPPLMPGPLAPVFEELHDYEHSAAHLHVESISLLSTSEETAAFLYSVPNHAITDQNVDEYLCEKFVDPHKVRSWIESRWDDPSPKVSMIEASTLYQFRLPHLQLAHAADKAGIRSEVVSFSVQSQLPNAYSPHCFPLPFLFGNRGKWFDAPMLQNFDDRLFTEISQKMQSWLMGFVSDKTIAPFQHCAPTRLEIDEHGSSIRVPQELRLARPRQIPSSGLTE